MMFQETEAVLFAADLAGFARASAQLRPIEIAASLDGWYNSLEAAIGGHGGGIVKYMGDGCLATFPPEGCNAAVEAALQLLARPPADLEVRVGVRIHLGVVAEGEIGRERRYDIFGAAVNHLFRMGGAGSVMISEPVYQRLAAERRLAWQRTAAQPAQPGLADIASYALVR
jgi:class 3 adenylate cyclase